MIQFVETSASEQRLLLCVWVERLCETGRRVRIATDSTTAARHIDELLWTFSEDSFVPHVVWEQGEETAENPNRAFITTGSTHLEGIDVLVCDTPLSLDDMLRYAEAVHFIIRDDADRKQESRLLWQEAKDRGVPVRHVPYESPSAGRGRHRT